MRAASIQETFTSVRHGLTIAFVAGVPTVGELVLLRGSTAEADRQKQPFVPPTPGSCAGFRAQLVGQCVTAFPRTVNEQTIELRNHVFPILRVHASTESARPQTLSHYVLETTALSVASLLDQSSG